MEIGIIGRGDGPQLIPYQFLDGQQPKQEDKTMGKPYAFIKAIDIAPTIPPKAGYPRSYEQMQKFRCEWWTTRKMVDGSIVEVGPFRSRDEALANCTHY